jgi:hypothetical protein
MDKTMLQELVLRVELARLIVMMEAGVAGIIYVLHLLRIVTVLVLLARMELPQDNVRSARILLMEQAEAALVPIQIQAAAQPPATMGSRPGQMVV